MCLSVEFNQGFVRRLVRQPDGLWLYGAFVQILLVASTCPIRGMLIDEAGPIYARGLADRTGFSEDEFSEALEALQHDALQLIEEHLITVGDDGQWEFPGSIDLLLEKRIRRCIGKELGPDD